MLRRKRLRMRTIFALCLAVLLLSGCSLFGADEGGTEIDPPLREDNDVSGFLNDSEDAWTETDQEADTEERMTITVYYKDPEGFVAPVSLEVPKNEAVARTTLEYMVEDGPGDELVPAGFTALLPKGTKILGTNIVDGKLIIDFSPEFASYNAQDERKILEAITWAGTEFSTVKEVELWINGTVLDEMPQDATPIEDGLTREMGINLERSQGVQYAQATPVTLFFKNEADGFEYLVPVTRLIPRASDVAAETVKELIRGPQNEALSSVIIPEAEVQRISKHDNIVHVDFDSSLLNPDAQVSSETLQAVVLSLIESTDASEVQITVDGHAEVVGTDQVAYRAPVAKPHHVNRYEL